MNGLVRIYGIDDKATYEKPRNFYNSSWDMLSNPCPDKELLPFWYDQIDSSLSLTVSEFKVREVSLASDSFTVLNTYTLTTGDISWDRGTLRDTFYYLGVDQSTEMAAATTGIYQFYVKLSDNSEYISEPFWWLDDGYSSSESDYDYRDYNATDFLTNA